MTTAVWKIYQHKNPYWKRKMFSIVNCTFHFSYSRPFLRRNLKSAIDYGKQILSNKKFQRKNDFWALCSQSIFAVFSRVNCTFHFSYSRPFLRRNLKKEIDSGKHFQSQNCIGGFWFCEHDAHKRFFHFLKTVFLFWRFSKSKSENWKKWKTLCFSCFFWNFGCEHNAHKVIFECNFLLLRNVFQSQFHFQKCPFFRFSSGNIVVTFPAKNFFLFFREKTVIENANKKINKKKICDWGQKW